MTVLRDRSFVEQMKTDILRRVEAPSDSEDEEVNIFGIAGKSKMREVAFDDELEDVGGVRVAGDGEGSSANEDEDEDEKEEGEPEMTPQTIVELAYIANPKVFERDAATRRSKERAALRAQTGALRRDGVLPLTKMRCVHELTWRTPTSQRLGGRTDRRVQDHARSRRTFKKLSLSLHHLKMHASRSKLFFFSIFPSQK